MGGGDKECIISHKVLKGKKRNENREQSQVAFLLVLYFYLMLYFINKLSKLSKIIWSFFPFT